MPVCGCSEWGARTARGLQEISAEAHAVDRAQAALANGLDMRRRRIAFAFCEMVARVFGIEFDHHLVSRHLRHD